jgi:hypothetical protein
MPAGPANCPVCNKSSPTPAWIHAEHAMDSEKERDLGSWTGLQNAFAAVGGSCSAARAACLKQIRDSGLLDDLGLTWDEFCHDYAGISRGHANQLIQEYNRFGDTYFRLSEITRISPKTFQQIAGHVASDNGADTLEINGEKLPVVPENAAKIRAAILSLRSQVRHPPAAPRDPPDVIEFRIRIDALARDFANAIAKLQFAGPVDGTRPALQGFAVYAMNKFRAFARQLDARI